MLKPELIPLVAARFRTLGEPGRLTLLAALQKGERSVSELVEATGRAQPNVSQHLSQLQRSGLVTARREANRMLYRLADPYIERICDVVCDSITQHAEQESRRLQAVARKGKGGRRA